ncbi:toprim domain-containing protein, partial [Prochlorococcus sp. AH-716-M10]|nr:toprim domain-containing protein [Prochlorococcus sp. AH-716-M10]
MDHTLVIVESPTKAKTIRRFLPPNYEVLASMGHVRDLPKGAAEIPASVKKEKWSRIGVNTTEDFEPLYIVPKEKKKVVKDLKNALKDATQLLLATDEDREGESISWHLMQILKPKIPTKRMVFHEITKKAINKALDETREIDMELVQAQETRRILDRLFGYELSPLLWKKVAPRLSAGRVQSVSVRLLVNKERERRAFKKASYWG